MPRRTVALCSIILALALARCTPYHVDAVWSEPRLLSQRVPPLALRRTLLSHARRLKSRLARPPTPRTPSTTPTRSCCGAP